MVQVKGIAIYQAVLGVIDAAIPFFSIYLISMKVLNIAV
jgi:hypothetical protein